MSDRPLITFGEALDCEAVVVIAGDRSVMFRSAGGVLVQVPAYIEAVYANGRIAELSVTTEPGSSNG